MSVHCSTVFYLCCSYNFLFQRWYLDGSIQCFRDVAHIIPGVLAIIILLGLILLIPLVVLLVVFKNHPFFQVRLHNVNMHTKKFHRLFLWVTFIHIVIFCIIMRRACYTVATKNKYMAHNNFLVILLSSLHF